MFSSRKQDTFTGYFKLQRNLTFQKDEVKSVITTLRFAHLISCHKSRLPLEYFCLSLVGRSRSCRCTVSDLLCTRGSSPCSWLYSTLTSISSAHEALRHSGIRTCGRCPCLHTYWMSHRCYIDNTEEKHWFINRRINWDDFLLLTCQTESRIRKSFIAKCVCTHINLSWC